MRDDIINELHTLHDYVRWGVSRFNEAQIYFGHGTDNSVDEALAIVLHALHLPHGLPAELLPTRLTLDERRAVVALVERRINDRVPTAYLTRKAWFAGHEFYVDERVLVPRSPIAELIEQLFTPWLQVDPVTRILDLGTGSGCIAVACSKVFLEATVDAVDISPDALAVAQRNIDRYLVEDRVEAIESDLFAALADKRYDLIVTNPPYVSIAEMETLPPEYRHEPTLGLVAGAEGLDYVERILSAAADHLTEDGLLVCEVGNSEDYLLRRYPTLPFFWVSFEHGGGGVFMLSYEQLVRHRAQLQIKR